MSPRNWPIGKTLEIWTGSGNGFRSMRLLSNWHCTSRFSVVTCNSWNIRKPWQAQPPPPQQRYNNRLRSPRRITRPLQRICCRRRSHPHPQCSKCNRQPTRCARVLLIFFFCFLSPFLIIHKLTNSTYRYKYMNIKSKIIMHDGLDEIQISKFNAECLKMWSSVKLWMWANGDEHKIYINIYIFCKQQTDDWRFVQRAANFLFHWKIECLNFIAKNLRSYRNLNSNMGGNGEFRQSLNNLIFIQPEHARHIHTHTLKWQL